MRIAIWVAFINDFGGPQPDEWDGQKGTIALLARQFKMKPGSFDVVRKVLLACMECEKNGIKYEGNDFRASNCGGKNKIILPNSTDEEIVADYIGNTSETVFNDYV